MPERRSHSVLGFIETHRRAFALLCVGLIAALGGVPTAAAMLPQDPAPVAAQSLAVADFPAPATVRDGFTISSYSVVQWPVTRTTRVSSSFGYRSCSGCSSDHLGIDFDPGAGTPVVSAADGVVTQAMNEGAYGMHVIVQHVIDGQTVSTLYAHLQAGSSPVAVGQTVERGALLGLVGSTGQSTGAHLHFGVLVGDDFIDPYPWLLAHVNV